jgi:hypothetical protein
MGFPPFKRRYSDLGEFSGPAVFWLKGVLDVQHVCSLELHTACHPCPRCSARRAAGAARQQQDRDIKIAVLLITGTSME